MSADPHHSYERGRSQLQRRCSVKLAGRKHGAFAITRLPRPIAHAVNVVWTSKAK